MKLQEIGSEKSQDILLSDLIHRLVLSQRDNRDEDAKNRQRDGC